MLFKKASWYCIFSSVAVVTTVAGAFVGRLVCLLVVDTVRPVVRMLSEMNSYCWKGCFVGVGYSL